MIVLGGMVGLSRRHGATLGALIFCLGSAVGLGGALAGLVTGGTLTRDLWLMMPLGTISIGMDGLTAFFLVPVFVIPALGMIYGVRYWPDARCPSAARVRLFFALLAAGMVLLMIARDAVSFLVGWEIMALSAFFLVTAEDERVEVREAGWLYLVAAHLALLVLIPMFSLIGLAGGGSGFHAMGSESTARLWIIFALATVGFGLKAGLMPLHVWLPSAHSVAPSHVSAVMSGLLIKAGIYGMVRVLSLLPPLPIGAGAILLVFGAVSALLGVVFALGQHDLKRLLAYHSIENIGIIVMGLGLATLGRSLNQPVWVALGLGGALLHVWNHGLFKALLFLSGGATVHAAGTREIDELGGLAKRMPITAGLFLLGAVAICGLPPLNGFISELLIYLGLFHTAGVGGGADWPAAALAAPILAMTGALAVACFVKVFGIAYLGEARTARAAEAHEAPLPMLVPMAMLALGCVAIGLAPSLVAPLLDSAISPWAPEIAARVPRLATLVPMWPLSLAAMLCWGACAVGLVWLVRKMRRGSHREVGTWDCGFASPTPRMQYTASSFAQMLVDQFSWALRPRRRRSGPTGPFPESAEFESHVPDPVLTSVALPAASAVERALLHVRWLQRGRVQMYILYVLIAVAALLLWVFPMRSIFERLAN